MNQIRLFCIWLLLLTVPTGLQSQNSVNIESAVVRIVATIDGVRSVGTGFVVDKRSDNAYILTAGHVVAGDKYPRVEIYNYRDELIPAEVIRLDVSNDLAILVIRDGAKVTSLQRLVFGTSQDLKKGDQLTAVGFPESGGAWALTKPQFAAREGVELRASGGVESGSSGGPLMFDGNVIGVVNRLDKDFARAVPAEVAILVLRGWEVDVIEHIQGEIGEEIVPVPPVAEPLNEPEVESAFPAKQEKPQVGNSKKKVDIVRLGYVGTFSRGMESEMWLSAQIRDGAQLAVEVANARKLKIGGRTTQIELLIEDDEQGFSSEKSAKRLLRAGVSGVIGHPSADRAYIAENSELYRKAGVPEVRPISTFVVTDSLAVRETIFSLLPDDHVLARGLGEFAATKQKAKVIAAICDETDKSRDLCDQFVRGTAHEALLGVHRYSVDQQKFHQMLDVEDDYDFAPLLSELRRVRADVVYIATRGFLAGKIVKEARDAGIRAKFIGSSEIQTPGFEKFSGRPARSSAAERTSQVPIA